MRHLFLALTIAALLAGCFGKTPTGNPAHYQLFITIPCFILATAFWIKHRKIKKELDDMDL